MQKEALIIFTWNPIYGKVKPRIAESLGNDAALAVYKMLAEHTKSITRRLQCDRFVFYSDNISPDDNWDARSYYKRKQQGANRGERMQAAFRYLFDVGYERVVIVWSDCNELTEQVILQAFELLRGSSLVIGPARDGGYYLLGMKKLWPQLFEEKSWGSPVLLKETLKDAATLRMSYCLLPFLNDIDVIDDIPAEMLAVLREKGLIS